MILAIRVGTEGYGLYLYSISSPFSSALFLPLTPRAKEEKLLPEKRKLNFSVDLRIRFQTDGYGSRLVGVLKWLGPNVPSLTSDRGSSS
jgi:hypothetical protein